jgi:hypothetical protein
MEEEEGRNLILLNTNTLVSKEQLQTVRELPHIDDAMVLDLPSFE